MTEHATRTSTITTRATVFTTVLASATITRTALGSTHGASAYQYSASIPALRSLVGSYSFTG